MTFDEILEQIIMLLKRQGRISYSALRRRFDLDDAYLEDLKDELLFTHSVVDEGGRGLVWTSAADVMPSQPDQAEPKPTSQQSRLARADSPPAEPPTPDAERRQLTVMFCDLADSTKLSGQLDLEDLRDVIRAYQSTSAEVIERFDGYIAQHLGDGLMVYFGWPQAHEDDARRAVHAGLGILVAMSQLNARLEQDKGIRLAVRIGIHTGLVVVGEVGQGARQEHLALGETPNVASRIEGIAEPDTIVISDVTHQLIEGYFDCAPLGQHTLKGVDEALQVYRAVSVSGAQSRFDVSVTRGLTPLVGRESEVTLLLERWRQAKEGQGQVVLLSGEAGIGKSRLLQVLRDHVASEPHTRLECRSSPYYQNTALYPITDMLQRILDWNQDDTPETMLNTLEQPLRGYRFELDEAIPLFANLLSLPIPEDRYPPLNLSPQRQRQKTLETIVAMLLRQAEQHPVLFILEDLHWTDPSTLAFLDLLLDQVPTAAICVLLTCRPAFQPPWTARSYLSQVTLNRLSRTQVEDMAERVVGRKRLPAEVMQQIIEKTDGVPLFVEEMTKAVVESGALKEVNGQYELAGSLSTLTIPATLQGSLMARLDRLVAAKVVAQYASVIGRQFSYELLQAVSQLNERTLQDELHRLVEAELVYQRGLPPQATYTFKHALIQDVAYQSLLKTTRQQYHQRIARVLENRFPGVVETQPELLAHHFTEAGLNEQAIARWYQAGQRAAQRSANVEAIEHLTKGLELLTTLSQTPMRQQQELDLQVTLGPALRAIQGNAAPDVEYTYARARNLCQQLGDTPQLFPVLRGLMMYYQTQGQLRTAFQLGEELLHLAQSQADPSLLLLAHHQLGMVLFMRGEPASAHTHHTQALAIYNQQEHRALALCYGIDFGVGSGSYASWELWQLGYPNQAVQHSQAALLLAQEVTHPYSQVHALNWAAILYQFRREVSAVHRQAAATTSLATEQGFTYWLVRGIVLHGWALVMQGKGEQGIAEMRRGLSAFLGTGAKAFHPYYLGLLAEAYGEDGHPEAGLHALGEAIAMMDTMEVRFYEAELHRLKGALLLKQATPDAVQAEACFHQALDIARRQEAKSWELRTATGLARLWRSQDKRQEAYDLLAPVYGWFTEGFDTADLKDAKALLEELKR